MVEALPESVQFQVLVLGSIMAVLWGLELVDAMFFRGSLNRLGIQPRKLNGLTGVVFAPLLHGSFQHLAANTGPLIVLGWLILLRGLSTFIIVTAVGWVISGLGAWLFGGRGTNHIGASGVVFGYFGFLLLIGYFEQSPLAIAVAVVIGLLYSSMIWGVLPIRRGKSWQSHLFGLIGGGLAARFLPELQTQFGPFLQGF